MKKIFGKLKTFILAPFVIYIYNLIGSPLEILIPINFITVLIVGFLGFPGLITLMLFLTYAL